VRFSVPFQDSQDTNNNKKQLLALQHTRDILSLLKKGEHNHEQSRGKVNEFDEKEQRWGLLGSPCVRTLQAKKKKENLTT